MIGLMPEIGPEVLPPEYVIEYHGGAASVSSYTWPECELGQARSDKRVYVLISYSAGSTRTLNSMSVAGVDAVRVGRGRDAASTANVEIWQADVDVEGGDIYCVWSGSVYGASIAIYAAYNLTSGALYSLGQNYLSTSGTSITNTVNTKSDTFVLAMCFFNTSSGVLSYTNAIDDTPLINYNHAGHDFAPPVETGRTITASSTVSASPRLLVSAVIEY